MYVYQTLYQIVICFVTHLGYVYIFYQWYYILMKIISFIYNLKYSCILHFELLNFAYLIITKCVVHIIFCSYFELKNGYTESSASDF